VALEAAAGDSISWDWSYDRNILQAAALKIEYYERDIESNDVGLE
jgi:hypothetical protein